MQMSKSKTISIRYGQEGPDALSASMTNRELVRAIMHYEPAERMPIVHFGFWRDTLVKWLRQGMISLENKK
jgi:hypothetical protein